MKKIGKLYSFGLLFTMLVSGCSGQKESEKTTSELDGETLMKTNCLTCHGNGTSHSDILAPPMMGVKNHYIEDGMSESDFVASIVSWTKNPTKEDSKMPGAIERFNVMPKQNFDVEEVESIAKYIYNNEMEKPQWFDQHMKEEHSEMVIEGLVLNDGEKWEANPETTNGINTMITDLNNLAENPTLEDYKNLGAALNETKGKILNQCTMKGPAHDNLHSFLMPLIRKIKRLKNVDSIEKAEKITSKIKLHLFEYENYFM